MDYSNLSMAFTYMSQAVKFHSDAPFKPNPLSIPQIKRSTQTNFVSSLFQLQLINSDNNSPSIPKPTISSTPPQLLDLLTKFQLLFDTSPTLPPPRNTDHQIHLLPNSTPVNVRPYRYPYYQKFETEKQVSELLASGLIQPSRSPFSSPVVLVKKKDG